MPGSGAVLAGTDIDLRQGRRPVDATLTVTLLLTSITTIAAWGNRGFIYDDPGIFWRYAEHLATGTGWDYNAHQAASASAVTSPLWVLLLAAGRLVAGPGSLPDVTGIYFAGLTIVAGSVTFATLRRLGHVSAGLVCAIIVVTCPFLLSDRGMETSLYTALIALVLYFSITNKIAVAGVASALLALTRPDGILLVFALIIWHRIRTRRFPVRLVGSFIATLAPWLIYAQIRFGSILPSTLSTKMAQGESGLWGHHRFIQALFSNALNDSRGWWILILVPLVVGLIRLKARFTAWNYVAPLLIYVALFVIGYTILGVPDYPWYEAPVYLLVSVIIGLGAERIYLWSRGYGSLVIGLFALAVSAVGIAYTPAAMPAVRSHYMAAGLWLKANTPSPSTVSSTEIGLIGYYSDRTMIDYLGVVTPALIPEVRRGDVSSWIGEYHPDYIVTNGWESGSMQAFIATRYFIRYYSQVAVIGGLVIYRWQ